MKKPKFRQAQRAAQNLLKKHAVSKAPVDVKAIANAEGIEIQFDDTPKEFSGMIFQEDMNTYILINKEHHPNRQRFTIAHELGHFSLHISEQLSLFVDEKTIYFRDDKSSMATETREIEANTFAAELLMPKNLLLEDLQGQQLDLSGDERELRKLARRYQVSTQALTLRLARLKLVAGFQ